MRTVELVIYSERDIDLVLQQAQGLTQRVDVTPEERLLLMQYLIGPEGPQGAQGPQGEQGETGAQGERGERGLTGADGPQGVQGEQGPRGLQGEKGDTGERGLQGLQGPQGEVGPQGETGPRGLQGEQGLQGPQGEDGPMGPQGTGVSILGTLDSVADLPPDAQDGDAYLIDGDLYVFNGGSYTNVGRIQGAEGPQGAQGPQGVKGDTGAQGPQGVKGDTGNTGADGYGAYTSKASEPTPADYGKPAVLEGYYWYNTSNGKLYVRLDGAWVTYDGIVAEAYNAITRAQQPTFVAKASVPTAADYGRAALLDGDGWFNSATGVFYFRVGNAWLASASGATVAWGSITGAIANQTDVQPAAKYGTYAARPTAASVPSGTIYSATDTLESYRSNGSSWALTNQGGAEIAHAQRTSPYSTTSDSFSDIPGLAFDYVAGEGGAYITYGATAMTGTAQGTPAVTTGVIAVFVDGVQLSQILISDPNYRTQSTGFRISGKTPGATVQVRVKARQANAPAAFNIFGDPVDKPFVRAVTC